MMRLLILVLISCLYSCYDSKPEERKRLAALECANKKSIDEINIDFFGYTRTDADSIIILQKRYGKLIDSIKVKIPDIIIDSIRHKRELFIKKEVLLTDTLVLILKDEHKIVSNYQYQVNNHNTMFQEDYGCDLMNVTVNGELKEGSSVDFFRKGFSIMDYKTYRKYYKELK